MKAQLRFYGSLNDFLGESTRHQVFDVQLTAHSELKDTIESCGVPHCEVDLVLVNGEPVRYGTRIHGQDFIEVFPVDVIHPKSAQSQVRPPPVQECRFVVDCNLGKLNSMLRCLGFDCFYENHIADQRAAEIAASENRVLLSKDRRILMRSVLRHGYWVRSQNPSEQVREVLDRFHLHDKIKMLSRCIDCNTPTVEVPKEEVWDRLEPLTKIYYDRFFTCPDCHKIFWKGSHYQKIREWREQLEFGRKAR